MLVFLCHTLNWNEPYKYVKTDDEGNDFSTEEANKILHSIYLFGSFIKTASANDIDILIIYHYFECLNEMKALYNIKEQIGNRLYGTFKIPIHFITLSTDELECICIPQQKFIKLY